MFAAGVLLTVLLVAVPTAGRDAAAVDLEAAIVRALEARLGVGAQVAIEGVEIAAVPAGRVVEARLTPGARLGAPLTLQLATVDARGGLAWTGTAHVRARVVVAHTHAVRPMTRGTQLGVDDVELASHAITSGSATAWPLPEELVHGRLRRDVLAGACLARTAVALAPAVQSGQAVVAIVRLDGVEATARLIAAGSGERGAVIRVVNEESRRVMRARVVSAGTVEILP